MINHIKVSAQIGVDDFRPAFPELHFDRFHRLPRIAPGPIAVTLRMKVRFVDWHQHQPHRRLHYAIFDRWDPQGPLLAIRIRDHHPSDGGRSIALHFELVAQFSKPSLCSAFLPLDLTHGHSIDTSGSAIGLHSPPRFPQDVLPTDLSMQTVEPPLRLCFRFPVERNLKFPNFLCRCSYSRFGGTITGSFTSLWRMTKSTAASLPVGCHVPQINATISSSDSCPGPRVLTLRRACDVGWSVLSTGTGLPRCVSRTPSHAVRIYTVRGCASPGLLLPDRLRWRSLIRQWLRLP